MIAVLDVDYDEIALTAKAAAVVFSQWEDAVPISDIQPYDPGEFFKRELPCLFAILAQVQEPLERSSSTAMSHWWANPDWDCTSGMPSVAKCRSSELQKLNSTVPKPSKSFVEKVRTHCM